MLLQHNQLLMYKWSKYRTRVYKCLKLRLFYFYVVSCFFSIINYWCSNETNFWPVWSEEWFWACILYCGMLWQYKLLLMFRLNKFTWKNLSRVMNKVYNTNNIIFHKRFCSIMLLYNFSLSILQCPCLRYCCSQRQRMSQRQETVTHLHPSKSFSTGSTPTRTLCRIRLSRRHR